MHKKPIISERDASNGNWILSYPLFWKGPGEEQPKETKRCKHRSIFSFVRKLKQVSISHK
ncbi:hypothetical protein N8216_01705 [Flavobacteriaceae bacterium]|nr:hypothetical protein [Flavobacteriaceae bacterium]